VHDDAA